MHQRSLLLPDELPTALAVADASSLGLPHLADWPYRFASWALDDRDNAQGWFDDAGGLLGWAVLQTPFWAFDVVAHPEAPAALYREMLAWATARARTLRAAGAGRPMWFVSISASCEAQRRDLDMLGFADVSEADENPWSKVLFALPERRRVASPPLPAGMLMRSLRVPEEVDAYVALHRDVFESDSMTAAWRARTTQMPGYRNALDLALTAEAGELCGFCVAWLRERKPGERVGQIEPLGIKQAYRGRGLSQALLAEAVQRLRDDGAGRIYVETDEQRESAMAAYRAMGFEVTRQVRVYRYDVPETPMQPPQ
jgi:ribosomal protein S18 acetylase RimI-like enzyme